MPARHFDADQCAGDLLREDQEVRRAVAEAFGKEVVPDDAPPDRRRLREIVFSDPESRRRLESILHPAIREQWISMATDRRRSEEWLCVDIPLLFETEAQEHFQRIVVVACSERTQRERLRTQRGLGDEMAAKIIAAQLDLRAKITQAHHLIWNDSTAHCLDRQAALLVGWLREYTGARAAVI
jgi:dephospho-CoA kinase